MCCFFFFFPMLDFLLSISVLLWWTCHDMNMSWLSWILILKQVFYTRLILWLGVEDVHALVTSLLQTLAVPSWELGAQNPCLCFVFGTLLFKSGRLLTEHDGKEFCVNIADSVNPANDSSELSLPPHVHEVLQSKEISEPFPVLVVFDLGVVVSVSLGCGAVILAVTLHAIYTGGLIKRSKRSNFVTS